MRLGPDPRVLDKREKIARRRLDLLDLVDPAPSRMRGFEVFRLYIVLLHRKMALLKCKGKPKPTHTNQLLHLLLEVEQALLNYSLFQTKRCQQSWRRS